MGFRVIKTAIAVVLSIYLALYLQLDSPYSAGLLAILGIDVTAKRSMKSVSARILASVLGMMVAFGLFVWLGTHIWVIGLYILLAYPVLVRVKLQDGIITSSVVMLHLFIADELNVNVMLNEALLLIVGLGTATVINLLYLPKYYKKMTDIRLLIEQLFSTIFREFALYLRDPDYLWDGGELLQADKTIQASMELARKAAENRLFHGDERWLPYFDMRRQQFESVVRMSSLIAQVNQRLPHGEALADLFESLSSDLKMDYYTGKSENKLNEMTESFKGMILPATRSEFEARAALLQLSRELGTYLAIAKRLKKQKPPEAD